MDNKRDVKNIEDDEHKYDQADNKYCLEVHMKQVENKSTRETHKCQYYQHLPYENIHTHYSSNIDHIEIFHHIFENSLELN